eukprot:s465_g10.t1
MVLNDSLSEVTCCCQVFHTSLAPRPKQINAQLPDDRKRKRLPSPIAVPKAKAKSQPKPDSKGTDTGTKYQESWPKKTTDGKGICIRFNSGKCKSGKACRYAHVGPIPNARGPKPVRTPSCLDGLPDNTVIQQLAVQESSMVHDRARLLLSAVDRSNGLVILENPATSMTWLDELMSQWVHSCAPYPAHASACQCDTDWAKTWCFVSNKPQIAALARLCTHAPGTHESVVGVRLPDGSFKSRLTAEYPGPLAAALAKMIGEFATHSGLHQKLDRWEDHLPIKLTWPSVGRRIEDGGGLPSSALCLAPLHIPGIPVMQKLRLRWFHRLCESKDCLRIVAQLRKGEKAPPLSDLEIQPYLQDFLHLLGVAEHPDEFLHVTPGQPFRLRLRLWKLLAGSWNDIDADFFDMLE